MAAATPARSSVSSTTASGRAPQQRQRLLARRRLEDLVPGQAQHQGDQAPDVRLVHHHDPRHRPPSHRELARDRAAVGTAP
jgi:hypothetical protein